MERTQPLLVILTIVTILSIATVLRERYANGTSANGTSVDRPSSTQLAPLRTVRSSPREFKLGDRTKVIEQQAKRVATAKATAELAERHLRDNQYINMYYSVFASLHKSLETSIINIALYITGLTLDTDAQLFITEMTTVHNQLMTHISSSNSTYNEYLKQPKSLSLQNIVKANRLTRDTIVNRLTQLKSTNSTLLSTNPSLGFSFGMYYENVIRYATVDDIVKRTNTV